MWSTAYAPARTDEFDLQWTRTVAPTSPPVSMREVKDHARISQSQGDATILRYIGAATDAAEEFMARGLLTQTWTLSLRRFADVIWLPRAAPLQNDPLAAGGSTVPVIQYYDTAGVLQTLASTYYVVDTTSRPGRIVRAPSQSWPAVQSDRLGGAVIVTYVVGWTSAALIPERIKQGIRIYVTWLDGNRDGMDGERCAAAEACWNDRVEVILPTRSLRPSYLSWPV